ncbi:MAG: HAD-IB family phosphatase [Planctomycetes bacterium]|nr:HAD-IB family phosphatase [Planctomycetota bacterium]
MSTHLVLDFDSTIVTLESLDELAAMALEGRRDRDEVLARIRSITDAGMDGSLPIDQSLSQRLALLRFDRAMVRRLIDRLHHAVSPSLLAHAKELREGADRVWVVTSGFHEWIDPVVGALGIERSHVRANRLLWSGDGEVLGLDPSSELASPRSKPRAVRALGLSGRVIAVGDGITDWEIRDDGAAHEFIAFTETAERSSVVSRADHIARDFGAVMLRWHAS